MPRLFIALPLETEDREKLRPAYEKLSGNKQVLKTVKPENYHITLKFLGECSSAAAENIERGFEKIQCPNKAVPFLLQGIGAFPNLKKPNVIWAGLKTDEKLINSLYMEIENFTADLGFEKEKRKFKPHLTLARVRRGKNINKGIVEYIEKNRDTIFGESAFKRLALFSSDLRPQGPVYTEVRTIYFK